MAVSFTMLQEELRKARFNGEQALRAAVAKEELAHQMFMRLCLMAKKAGVLGDDPLTFEEAIQRVDDYLEIPKEKEVLPC